MGRSVACNALLIHEVFVHLHIKVWLLKQISSSSSALFTIVRCCYSLQACRRSIPATWLISLHTPLRLIIVTTLYNSEQQLTAQTLFCFS